MKPFNATAVRRTATFAVLLTLGLWAAAAIAVDAAVTSAAAEAEQPANQASETVAEPATEPIAEPTAEQAEFFEKQVRPILVARCHKCHSGNVDEPKGSLRLDARSTMLGGGDSGAAIVPGKPAESMMIDAINYRGDYEMPPKSKLPAAEIDVLTRWVAMGAPWPGGDKPADTGGADDEKKFDLERRKAEHWAWQPVVARTPPDVHDSAWSRSPIDRFVQARLEDSNLKPAQTADKPTLLRRLYFDLIGLPPSPIEVDAFVADDSPDAFERVVDRLLASPAFGEHWARHWLDLMRYAETRGHEFDFAIPNAYEYRDYVVRALNADVPYDTFVTEHVAGDLVRPPRLHSTTGGNESILGTAFWHLGEGVHSPVDIRKDETDRIDNAVDVLSKTFLAMTVSCARCHDHKFDAISTRDYYALAGYLQSAEYRLAPFDTMEHNRRVADEIWRLDDEYRPRLLKAFVERVRPGVERTADYLLAAREAILAGPSGENKPAEEAVVFESFESGDYSGWTTTGDAFGERPQTLKTIAPYQGKINAVGEWFVNSHNVRSGEDIRRGDQYTGTMTSREFTVAHDYITFWIGGGAHAGRTCMNLLVDGKVVRTATGRNNNQMSADRWNVRDLRGKSAQFQIVDAETGGWGNVGVDEILLTNTPAGDEANDANGRTPDEIAALYKDRAADVARRHDLSSDVLLRWIVHLLDQPDPLGDALSAWRNVAMPKDVDEPRAFFQRGSDFSGLCIKREVIADVPLRGARLIFDYAAAPSEHWLPDGPQFGPRAVRPGDVRLSADEENPIVGVALHAAAERDSAFDGMKLAAGVENDPVRLESTVRMNRSIRTPTFGIESGRVWALVRGAGDAYAVVDSHRLNNGPLHEALLKHWEAAASGQPHWVGWDLTAYKGHRAHIEFSAREIGDFAVLGIVESDSNLSGMNPAIVDGALANDIYVVNFTLDGHEKSPYDSPAGFARAIQTMFVDVAIAMGDDRLAGGKLDKNAVGPTDFTDQDYSVFRPAAADWLVRHADLFATEGEHSAAFVSLAKEFADKRRELTSTIRRESRAAPAMWDGTAEDEHLLIRGNSNTPGPLVPRRFLEALGGMDQPPIEHGSGRLELARQMTDHTNPLTARVMANRLWHHLLGRGIVASVDNFGVLGERPTHPELLDYLATRLIDDGWSLKRQIRSIVGTSTYCMASRGEPAAEAADPMNRLWHRAERKRLAGEAIRDAMLVVSGRFDDKMYGRSVNEHLTDFLEGRGRPASGPLDGDGRRSVYIGVRRNFLSPMMMAFDTPPPVSTVGRRNVSNVPAQALMLLNGPFVVEQARIWADRVLSDGPKSSRDRIDHLYREAFARTATDEEIADALSFLDVQGEALGIAADARANDPRLWADLCHVLFNVKEFVFVP
ncbi:MAG: PSD1 and planctomycete cytochrome C domain-containing protein [Pirellulales bacterium]